MSLGKSTLFLGDLSAFCSEADIHALFTPYGEVTEIKIMRSEETLRNLSYGFLKFANPASAKKAMNALDGLLFGGRHLRVGWASYKNKRDPSKMLQHQDKMDSSSVHISYISYQLKTLITEESLRILFSTFGVVLDCSIKKSYLDRSINRQCGYGFVHFSSSPEGIESALAAVTGLNDKTIEDVCYKCSISHNLEKHLIDMQTGRPVYHQPALSASYMYEPQPQQQVLQQSGGYASYPPPSAAAMMKPRTSNVTATAAARMMPPPNSWAASAAPGIAAGNTGASHYHATNGGGNAMFTHQAAFQAQPQQQYQAYYPSPEKKRGGGDDLYATIDHDLVRSVRQQHAHAQHLSPHAQQQIGGNSSRYSPTMNGYYGSEQQLHQQAMPKHYHPHHTTAQGAEFEFLSAGGGSAIGSDGESSASSVGSSGLIGPFLFQTQKSIESTTKTNSSHSGMIGGGIGVAQLPTMFTHEEPSSLASLGSLRLDDQTVIASVPSGAVGPTTGTRGFYDDLLKLSIDDLESSRSGGFMMSPKYAFEYSFFDNTNITKPTVAAAPATKAREQQNQVVGGFWESSLTSPGTLFGQGQGAATFSTLF